MEKWKIREMKSLIQKIWFFCLPSSTARINYIKKHKIFDAVGENFFFQPRKLPADPKFIRFHNNISVATDVTFLNHDVIYLVFRELDNNQNAEHMGCIEVLDNVFIGGGSIILPNVKIGPNTIVGAGSIVTKDVPPGTVVGGNPARVIGTFDDVVEKRGKEAEYLRTVGYTSRCSERAKFEWERFEKNI